MHKIFFSIAAVSSTLVLAKASAMPNPAPAFACSTSNCTLNGNNNYVSANAGGNSIAAGFGGNASAPLFMTQASAGGNSATPGLVPAGTTISYLNTYPNGVQAQVLTGTTKVYVTIISRSGQFQKNGDSSSNPQLDFVTGQQAASNSAIYHIYLSEAIVEFVKGLGSTNLWTATKTYYQGSSTKSYPSTLSFGKAVYVTDTSSSLPANWFCKKGNSTCATVDPGFYGNTTSLNGQQHAGSFKSKADFTTWTTSLLQTKVIPWDPTSGVYVFVIQPGSFYKQDPNTPVVYPSEGLNTLDCSVHDAAWITPFGQGGILTYAIIGAPNKNGNPCFDRIQALTGLDPSTRSSAILRLSVLNDIAHELLEIVTNPIPFQSWAVTVDNIPYEAGDLCRNVFLSKSSTKVQPNSDNSQLTYLWNVELSNGHKYLVQGMWNAATQSCVGA